jgi:hypothetical protein
MIEEAAMSDPVQLQEGFDAYNDCSSYSTKTQLFLSEEGEIKKRVHNFKGMMMNASLQRKYIHAVGRGNL